MRIWIYGAPFSGKTTFASQYPGAKIISTDGNAEYLFPKENIMRVKSYADLDKAISEIRKNPPETLVVDTTEYLMDYIRLYFLSKNKIDDESDLPYKGYKMLRSFQWEIILTISNLCDNVIFVSHEAVFTEKNKFGREITYYTPDFDEKLKDKMMGLMTVVMRAVKVSNEKNDSSYVLHIGHTDEEFGGTRKAIKNTEIPNTKKDFNDNFVVSTKKFDAEAILTGEQKIEDTYATKNEVASEKKKTIIG